MEEVDFEPYCPVCDRAWVWDNDLLIGYWKGGSSTDEGRFHSVWEGCFEPEGEVEMKKFCPSIGGVS